MSVCPIKSIRVVEPCQTQARPPERTDEHIPFDAYLKKQNREDDRLELTGPAPQATYARPSPKPEQTTSTDAQHSQEDRPAKRFEPVDVDEETRREIVVRYEIPSDKLTGRLIDMLL